MQSATPPVKRGRGRPRKNPAQPSSVVAGPASAPVKRGRGRPRKNPAEPSLSAGAANTPVKRGRGRPRKSPVATPFTAAQSSVSGAQGNSASQPTENEKNDPVAPKIESSVSGAQANTANQLAEEEKNGQVTPNTEAPVIHTRSSGEPRNNGVNASMGIVQSLVAGVPADAANCMPDEEARVEVAPVNPVVGNHGAGGPEKTLVVAPASNTAVSNHPASANPGSEKDKGGEVTRMANPITKRGRGRPRKNPRKERTEKVNVSNVGDSHVTQGGGPSNMKVETAADVQAMKEEPGGVGKANSDKMDILPTGTSSSQNAMATVKNEDPPVKRGRGRPRKNPVPEGAMGPPAKRKRGRPKKVPAQSATETAGGEATTVKRGRGRPRKNPAPPSSLEPPVKRKRGRPRKDQAQSAEATPGVEGTPVKRGRGRPRKNPALSAEATPGTEGTTVKRGRGRPRKHPAPPISSEPPAKRKRGRPRKDQAQSGAARPGTEGTPVKRGRGRPRKQETSAIVPVPIAPRASAAANAAVVPPVAERTAVPIAPRVSEPASAALTHPAVGLGVGQPGAASGSIPIAPRASAASTTPGVEGTPVKRGRGRPRKKVTAAIPIAPSGSEVTPASGVEGTPGKRGRGRPKKEVTAAIPIAPSASETTLASGVEGAPVKRGRGRPRKEKTATTLVEGVPVKPGRGRPKKQVVVASVPVPIAPRAGEAASAVGASPVSCLVNGTPDGAISAVPIAPRAGEVAPPIVMNPVVGVVAGTSDAASAPVPIALSGSEAAGVVAEAPVSPQTFAEARVSVVAGAAATPPVTGLVGRKPVVETVSIPLPPHEASNEQTLVTPSLGAFADGTAETVNAPVPVDPHASEPANEGVDKQSAVMETTDKETAGAVKDILTNPVQPIPQSSSPTLEQEMTVHVEKVDVNENPNEESVQAQTGFSTEPELELMQIENVATTKDISMPVNLDQDQTVSPLVIANPRAKRYEEQYVRDAEIPIIESTASMENGTHGSEKDGVGNTYDTLSLPPFENVDNIPAGQAKDAEGEPGIPPPSNTSMLKNDAPLS